MGKFNSCWNKMSEGAPEECLEEGINPFYNRYRLALKTPSLAMVDRENEYLRCKLLGREEWYWLCAKTGLIVNDEGVWAWQVAESCLLIDTQNNDKEEECEEDTPKKEKRKSPFKTPRKKHPKKI